MLKQLKALFAGLLFIFLLPLAAMAQETTVAVGDLISPWLELLLAAAAIIIPAVATWAAAELRRRTGISIEASHRNAFQTALLNGAGLLVAQAKNATAGVSSSMPSIPQSETRSFTSTKRPPMRLLTSA